MFPAERLNRIREILTEKKQIDISQLSSLLNVTEVTIRRDLEKLESEGFLNRTHGGAVLVETASTSFPSQIFELDKETEESLKMLGELSGFLINDNDVIFLGPGMSNRFFYNALKNKHNITIVTNDILVAINIAVNAPETKIICPSGELNNGTLQLYGRIGEDVLSTLNYNVAFIDVDGITMERGYTVSSIDKVYLIQDILKSTDKAIAVCSHKKFNQSSFVPLGPLNMFSTIISNEQTPKEYKEYFFHNDIQLFCTFDAYRG